MKIRVGLIGAGARGAVCPALVSTAAPEHNEKPRPFENVPPLGKLQAKGISYD
jgi:hypothetical protein